MNSSAGPASAHDPPASDIYDPDEVFPRNSPLMKPRVLKLKPSPSPPAVTLPLVSLSPRLGGKSSNRRHKIQPTQGDAVLILHLDGGRRPEISQEAGYRPLDQFNSDECQSGSESEETMGDDSEDEDGIRSNGMSPIPTSRFTKPVVEPSAPEPASVPGSVDLRSLATDALAAAQAVSKTTDVDDLQSVNHETQGSQRVSLLESSAISIGREMPILNTKRPVLAPPISPYPVQSSPEIYSPRQHTPSQVLMHPNNVRSPTSLPPGSHGELAPLQMASPRSDSSNHETLPSIRSQFFEQLHSSPKDLAVRPSPHFPHSPPTGPSRLGAIPGTHTSPPISPNEAYRNNTSIPSPANTLPALSPYPYSSTNSHQSPPGLDYNANGAKLERSSISQILTPPTDRIADRMSIDSMTNPQIGMSAFIMSIRIKMILHCVTCLHNALMALIEAGDVVAALDALEAWDIRTSAQTDASEAAVLLKLYIWERKMPLGGRATPARVRGVGRKAVIS
ncbi:hypothetical protein E0Z10_g6111 [Xylaria hypoxylon]|uniref:Uncharacterized protein n=1 Tax=Xylaria hypoxylon TaxID=37992 RepID=A0A4Z0YEK1_9PEZI|nr:hypothetical protein E0Z10_g6111 [Xylaria hypoxylon]